VKYLVLEVLYLSYFLFNLGLVSIFIIGFLNVSHVKNSSLLLLLLVVVVLFNDTVSCYDYMALMMYE
jgi:hypothetical protein